MRVAGYFHFYTKLKDIKFLHTALNVMKTHPNRHSTPIAANLSNTLYLQRS